MAQVVHTSKSSRTSRIAALVLGALAGAAVSFAALGARAADGTLVWARDGDSDSLDPQRTTTTLSWEVFAQIYDSLLAFDESGKIGPHLAKNWVVSPDGKEVSLTLNGDVTCHDGAPFTAEDVKYTKIGRAHV